ncbi:hypothetical protein MGYG_03728 [Nannizzia gypsea CBS 118893]|uniref:Uncharacterized protein n=1 Tax=Arthroderma gypseum (strain ATCC MYA-4604 / CBS 118893) TaxID=535722 RepID=E4UTL4_ARTGP|nr:hypothetical protein MGYG_03728 [Nannizzia gypsea CBS 118893]EFR00723.1 hypothetical protein MGYG_03728 [Nannizzia gypsea CBS 118893]
MAEAGLEDTSPPIPMPSANNDPLQEFTAAQNLCKHDGTPSMFHTCEHPYHSNYSSAHLPPLLFRLESPQEPFVRPAVHLLKKDEEDSSTEGSSAIRDFPFLPQYISVRAAGWLLEYWMRTDSRLTYRDIKARMTAAPADIPSDNALNMRREREARSPLGLSCWTTRRGSITKAEVERVERLSQPQISLNTTTTIEYATSGGSGEQVPRYLLMKRLDGGPPHRYPLDTFLDGKQGPHVPGQRIESTIQLLYQLQDYANALEEDDWRSLAPEYLPETWARRVETRLRRQAEKATENEVNLSQPALSGNIAMSIDKDTENGGSGTDDTNDEVTKTGANKSDDQNAHLPEASPGYHNVNLQASISSTKKGPLSQTSSPSSEVVDSPAQFPKKRPTNAFANNQPVLTSDTLDLLDDCDGPCCQPFTAQKSQPTLSDSSRETPTVASMSSRDSNGDQDSGSDLLSEEADLLEQHGGPLSIRFNGGGEFSIRNNPYHRLNTHTAEIMARNNPFADFLPLPSNYSKPTRRRSFDDFFAAELE